MSLPSSTYISLRIIFGLCLALIISTPASAVVSLGHTIKSSDDGKIQSVAAMFSDAQGDLLVLDRERGSLTTFKSDSVTSHLLAGEGSSKAFKSEHVQGFASLGDGKFLVSNSGDDDVIIIDSAGKKLGLVAGEGSAQGELSDPMGIAWSSNRHLYVADSDNNRISVFGDDGVFIRSIGDKNMPQGQALQHPTQVFVDPQERIYVLEDHDDGVITVFDHTGRLLKRLNADMLKKITSSKAPEVGAITIDDTGLLYVADNRNGRVYQIDWEAGRVLTSFGSKGEQRGQFKNITALAVMPGDKLAVADSGNKKIDVYQLPPAKRAELEQTRLPTVGFDRSTHLKCNKAYRLTGGSILCLDADNNKVGTFNASGRAETAFQGKFSNLIAASVNDQNVAILDGSELKIYRLDGDLRYKVGGSGSAVGQFDSPRGVFMGRNKIYVADTGNSRIQIFSKDGIFLNSVSNPGDDKPAIFSEPTRVVVDANKDMYVLDKEQKHVLVFGPDHQLLYKIGGSDDKPLFEDIYDIAIDADNNLYILAAVPGNKTSVQVYSGPKKVISFGASNDQSTGMDEPVALSVAPEHKTVVSVFDKEKQTLINYKYMQLPARLGGLVVRGSIDKTSLLWQRVPGSYISRYKVYGSDSKTGPFKYITDVGGTEAQVEHKDKPAKEFYRVSAVSGFGVEGEASNIREDIFQVGYALFADKKYDDAMVAFKKAYDEDHNNGALLKYLGQTSMQLGQVQEAVEYFRELTQMPGYEAEGRNLQVKALVAVKDYVAAKAVIDRAIADNTASVDTIVYCGELSMKLDDAIGAVNCLETALKKQPDNIKAHFLMGQAYVKLGIIDKGLKEFKTAVSLDPKNAEVWYQNGNLLEGMGKHDEAIVSLKKAVELKPDYSDAQLALARVHFELKHYDEVRTIAIRLAGQKATEAEGDYLLGITSLAANKNGEALLALNKATRADANYTAAWLALADTYIRMKQTDKVRPALVSANKADANSFVAAQRLGLLDYEAGDYAKAAQSLEHAAVLKPDDYDTQYKLADAEYHNGNYKQADAAASSAVRLKPDAWEPLLLQANIANRQGKNGKAIGLVKEAMAKQPDSAVLTTRLGDLYSENSMFDLAKTTLEKASLLDPTSAKPFVLLGALYMHTRSYDDAIAALDKAVSIDATPANKLALDTAYAEKKKSLEFKSNAPHIVFEEVKLNRVFSAAYKQYADKPVGTVVIKNSGAQDYGNLKLTFAIKGYMDYPTTIDIPELKANSQQSIELNASFNNKILDIDEDTGVQAEIALNYIRDGQNDAVTITQPMTIYGKNAIVWGESDMVGSFVTPKDNVLSDFVRTAINENKPRDRIINNSLLTAMTLFDVFGAHGIRYEADPNTPYSKLSDTSVDYVQFGRETLKVKSGDCDDLSVLMSASLENLGIETAILDVPGHLLMMFNTGLPEAKRSQISLDDDLLALRDGMVWVPVEATMIGQSFAEAWAEGARKYHKYEASHQLKVTTLAQAWKEYKPVTLKPAAYTLTVPPTSLVEPVVTREKNILLEKTLDRMVSPYRTMANLDPSNIKARMQIAIIYARYGLYEKAEHELDEIQKIEPDNSAVQNNRGNIYFSKGDYERALENYSYAEKLDSNDAGIKMNLSMAYYKQGNLQQASEKYAEAKVIDATVSKKYEAYAKLLSK